MKRNFKIYQQDRMFNEFEVVYEGALVVDADTSDGEVLEKLFYIFNMQHPAGYKGRSLSVGDLVNLDGKVYQVASCGYKQM